jgi:hypothetical protein
MDMQQARDQLEHLFFGVTAPFEPRCVPPGVEPIRIATALGRAIAIVYACEIEEVRAALGRIEAGLPHDSVSSLIQKERAAVDKLEANVASLMTDFP